MARKGDWIKAGGKHPGELGHCERCGETLVLNLPQSLAVVVGAMKGFVQVHKECRANAGGKA